jgi:hypothetical protein
MTRALYLLVLLVGCGTNPPTPDPGPSSQLTIDCGAPVTRAQMAESAPVLSRCVQAATPVDSCVSSLQISYTLEALVCAARIRGMQAWRARDEGTGTAGDALEATALRDWLKTQNFRFKY